MTSAVPRPKRQTPVPEGESITFSIRMPGEVYNELDAVAKEEDRYLNAQIVRALREWLTARKEK